MGKFSSLIFTAVFIGAIAFLVYLCCRVKRKRNLTWSNWQDFFRQNPNQVCEGTQAPGIGPGPTGYDRNNVPHSIAEPNMSYPYGQPTGYPYPESHTYPSHQPQIPAVPYPMGQPNMPMPPTPGFMYDPRQQAAPAPYPYPSRGYPDELPPPYSAVVGPTAPKY